MNLSNAASGLNGVRPDASQGLAPAPIKAIPVRHYGRWFSAALIAYLLVALAVSLANNQLIHWPTVWEFMFADLTLDGVKVTIYLTIIAMVIGVVGGTTLAVMRLSDNFVLSGMAWAYIWFFRGTPQLVQIIFWGFLGSIYPQLFMGIPFTGVLFGSWDTSRLIGATTAGILALGLNEAAYAAELVRAGIISVDSGQNEAAQSLGMSGGMTMRLIVLPQAMRVIIPPMGNETIYMLKATSLVYVIAGRDLMTNLQIAAGQNYRTIELLIVASIWYLALTTLLSIGQHYLEAYFGKGFGAVDTRRAARRSARREARHAAA